MLGIQSGNSHGDCGTELTRFTYDYMRSLLQLESQ